MVSGDNQYYEKSYWGAVAQTPGYEEPGENYHRGLARHSGSGEYAGIFVLLVAVLAIAQSFRKQNSPFSVVEKRFVWFWSIIALISLLLALGRHGFFYQFVFALPYFSTVRNPIKFMHPFHIALLILFAYGLESMARRYFENVAAKTNAPKNWGTAFEKKWILFSSIALGVGVLGWMIYTATKPRWLAYLETHFPADLAAKIARFSIGEVTWFILFLAASVILVAMILRGKFAGNLKLAAALMGGLIVIDLAHADVHWILYDNYKQKYASNPIIEILKDKPYEHRVVVGPAGIPPFLMIQMNQRNQELGFLQNIYYLEWLQHHFYFYNIQTLDIPQEPRASAENTAFRDALRQAGTFGQMRLWQLANVRYVLGLTDGFIDSFLNGQIDPQKRFRLHTPFTFYRETDAGPVLIQTNSTGPFALIEFTGALPRAKLYNNWQVVTNDEAA
jgi:hypothetical protein